MTQPLDMHAHIEPTIAASELVALNACVVAMTRRLDEFDAVRSRSDASTIWGVGCHPALVREVRGYEAERMRDAIRSTAVIGEVGLDGAARTPLAEQTRVLRSVLEESSDAPRLISLHSYQATDKLLELLTTYKPQAAILHWWLGSPRATEAALEAGAYFSVNASQAAKWPSLRLVPADRIFLETDHPFGDKSERGNRRPGALTTAEAAVAQTLELSVKALRTQTWRNLRKLCEDLALIELLPRAFQVQLLAA